MITNKNNNTPINWTRSLCIGKGSFGTVDLAVDKINGELFAVKSANQTSSKFSEALENEIRILKSLSSPFVVSYRDDDVTSENSVVYRNLHMEYMPGGTVADLDEYDDVMVRNYTRCIVSALSYIHSKNIVHCDVKGRNVLVGADSESAKLADLGSALELGGPNSGTRGSPLWMAPEVVRGEYQGPESDVWSLGCTVIEMITGKPAWQDRGVDTLFQIGYSDELPDLPAQMPNELCDFVSKCIRRDRSERWSCDQLLQHPYLLSCNSQLVDKKWSPRCVFDWPSSSFSDVSDEETSEIDDSNLRKRIGTLCSGLSPNWESDGWELVRNVTVTNTKPTDFEFGEYEEMEVSTPEYSDTVVTIHSGSERTNWEYRDSDNAGYYENDDQCTNKNAESTSSGWTSRDMDNNYSCCIDVSLNKLLLVVLFNWNATRHICFYKCLFLFNVKLYFDFVINCLPTLFCNEDFRIK
ncbi:mitogen-activated protein kinase kinase kinase 18 [Rutidosis leptorrhynchoides]|uniref:mitogen-activated protein kinase kinase kinase 18 n=1 Tax=Rutidosis leptorrhynchoides TaxID=125765 RepID=UPI003A994BB4